MLSNTCLRLFVSVSVALQRSHVAGVNCFWLSFCGPTTGLAGVMETAAGNGKASGDVVMLPTHPLLAGAATR